MLAQKGYDVWMPNSRGNIFSMEHENHHFDPKQLFSKYWDFTFNEMAKYDVPANIDYVKNATGYEKIDYLGHSQGSFSFFLAILNDPDYINKNIASFSAIGTVVTIFYIVLFSIKLQDSVALKISELTHVFSLLHLFHLDDLLDFGTSIDRVIHFICERLLFICKTVISSIISTKITNRVDWRAISDLYYYEPGGTSTKNLIHWLQVNERQELAQYDYGKNKNMKVYGTPEPPRYNVTNFRKYNVKTFLTVSDSDPFSDERDIDFFVDAIDPLKKEMVQVLKVTNYNHLDYLWSESAVDDIYKHIFEFLQAPQNRILS